MDSFDVVVVGGGPGGYATALYGAAAGLEVALVEEARVGGTCLHQGCIPAKELLQTAEVLRTVRSAATFGVGVDDPELRLPDSQQRKQQVIDTLTKGLETLLKGRKVTVHAGRGTITDVAGRRVAVSDGAELHGTSALVVATGSSPRPLPGLPFDGKRILSSDHVLELAEVPERVAIIGAGAIGCEFASLLSDFGSEVTLLEAMPAILPGVDKQAADVVKRSFAKRGITTHTGVQIEAIQGSEELTVGWKTDDGGAEVTVDKVIVSIGREPRAADIGLEGSGVGIDDRGYVEVDGYLRTGVDGVFAVGDVVASPALAHVAFAEAIVAIKTLLGEPVVPVEYSKVPWGIYCHPEVSFSGLTEDAAREAGYDVETSVHRFAANSRARIMDETEGLVKIVAERDGAILGVHVVGPWATELLGEGYLAVNWEATATDFASLIHPHPTLSETFGEAALALTGRGLH